MKTFKGLYYLIVVLCFISLFSCSKDDSDTKENPQKFCGKWSVVKKTSFFDKNGDENIQTYTYNIGEYYWLIKSNGDIYEAYSSDNIEGCTPSEWYYKSNKIYIDWLDGDGKIYWKVNEVTEKTMILEFDGSSQGFEKEHEILEFIKME